MKRYLQRILVVLMVVVSFLAMMSVAYASTWATVVEPKGLNYRDAPQGNVIGTLRYGTKVEVLSGPDRNSYYKVRINGQEYYMFSKGKDDPEHYNLDFSGTVPTPSSPSQTQQTSSGTKKSSSSAKTFETKYFMCQIGSDECECKCYGIAFVKCDLRLRLRTKPSLEAGTRAWLDHGKPMIVLDNRIQYGFVKVKDPETGTVGWSWASLLSADMLEDVTYVTEPCEDYGCCQHENGEECWTSVQWFKDK